MLSILKIFFLLLFVLACSPSPTESWLQEYKALLLQGANIFEKDPYSLKMEEIKVKIAEKEAEIDTLLRSSSTQEQMSFLSKYYDARVNFYYSITTD